MDLDKIKKATDNVAELSEKELTLARLLDKFDKRLAYGQMIIKYPNAYRREKDEKFPISHDQARGIVAEHHKEAAHELFVATELLKRIVKEESQSNEQ